MWNDPPPPIPFLSPVINYKHTLHRNAGHWHMQTHTHKLVHQLKGGHTETVTSQKFQNSTRPNKLLITVGELVWCIRKLPTAKCISLFSSLYKILKYGLHYWTIHNNRNLCDVKQFLKDSFHFSHIWGFICFNSVDGNAPDSHFMFCNISWLFIQFAWQLDGNIASIYC